MNDTWFSEKESKDFLKIPYHEWFVSLITNPEDDPGAYLTKCSTEPIAVMNPHFNPRYPSTFGAQMVTRPVSDLEMIINFYDKALTYERGHVHPWIKIGNYEEYEVIFDEISDDYWGQEYTIPSEMDRQEKSAHEYVDKYEEYKDEIADGGYEHTHEQTTIQYTYWRKAMIASTKFFERAFDELYNKDLKGIWCQCYLGNGDMMYSHFDAVVVENDEIKIYRVVLVNYGDTQIENLFTDRGLKDSYPSIEWKKRIEEGRTGIKFDEDNSDIYPKT